MFDWVQSVNQLTTWMFPAEGTKRLICPGCGNGMVIQVDAEMGQYYECACGETIDVYYSKRIEKNRIRSHE